MSIKPLRTPQRQQQCLGLVPCHEYDLVVSGKGRALLQGHRQVDGIERTQPMLLPSPSESGTGGAMAFRRAKIKEQFDGAIPAVLEPGEQVQAETLSQSGPSPWLAGVIGWLIMLIAGARLGGPAWRRRGE